MRKSFSVLGQHQFEIQLKKRLGVDNTVVMTSHQNDDSLHLF
ncbi:hypothetical protein SeseC_00975 [Streptococcus equi subsp. zooepidemicus ATCC 35246]|nr:hypothetical protein SeseC_00975 [Streptococcus equi subsp. zooepidemicus ATCC 35246]